MNLLQFTGPFDSESWGGLEVGCSFMSKMIRLWSEVISIVLYMLQFICLGIDEMKKSKMSG